MSTLCRNLVVCCDGTMNEPESQTNVKLFKDAVSKFSKANDKRPAQIVHYEKGVGTRAFEALRGGIYGYGLGKRVLDSYGFLRGECQLSKKLRQESRLYLLGFSRGAYTARRLSGLLNHSGIPKKAVDEELGWELYKTKNTRDAAALKREGRFFDVEVQMVGVWDTVKSTTDAPYNDNKLASNVKAGFHAMAIDERRKFFPVMRWDADKKRILQMWFAGVHSDVGGGYEQKRLSNVALRWMIHRAMGQGLLFNGTKVKAAKQSAYGKMHDSLTTLWQPLGEKTRRILKNDLVHDSVRKRIAKGNYHPANMPAQPKYWTP